MFWNFMIINCGLSSSTVVFFVSPFRSYIQIVWCFKVLLWTFFKVHACIILGDFYWVGLGPVPLWLLCPGDTSMQSSGLNSLNKVSFMSNRICGLWISWPCGLCFFSDQPTQSLSIWNPDVGFNLKWLCAGANYHLLQHICYHNRELP